MSNLQNDIYYEQLKEKVDSCTCMIGDFHTGPCEVCRQRLEKMEEYEPGITKKYIK